MAEVYVGLEFVFDGGHLLGGALSATEGVAFAVVEVAEYDVVFPIAVKVATVHLEWFFEGGFVFIVESIVATDEIHVSVLVDVGGG